ncbi:carotenoid biosynthesis protein [Allokutzneria sp. NRRL B-24872]|uniref:carotenoid biosynthesis protein n=1 Tax=Allokutzneria sp. NRRL B-24872 TaxID=1137961 RepID=UPI00143CC1AC|nr:carotenoid biosynthesis protein [Allokutzneria sp. NRRL B-24872]
MPPKRSRARWLATALAVVSFLLTVWAVSPPGGYFGIALAAFCGWLATGVVWLVMAVRAVLALPQPRRAHLRQLRSLLVLPLVFAGVLLLAGSGVLSRAIFEMHRPGLHSLVADVAAAPDQRLVNQRVGLFAVSSATARHTAGCTLLAIKDAGFLGSAGFAHCPDRPPVNDAKGGEGTTFEYISGPWYTFSYSW